MTDKDTGKTAFMAKLDGALVRHGIKTASSVTIKFIAAVVAVVGIVFGYLEAKAGMEASVTAAIQTAAPDKKVIEDLSASVKSLAESDAKQAISDAAQLAELKGMRSDSARDREEFRSNHIDARGEINVLRAEQKALEKLVNKAIQQGVSPELVKEIETRLRAVEQKLAALESAFHRLEAKVK